MDLLDVILGRSPSLDEAEEELGKPEQAEANDLPLHVSRCAMRWKLSYRLSRSNNVQLSQMRVIIIGLAVYLVLKDSRLLALITG